MRLIDADALEKIITEKFKEHYGNTVYQFIHDFFTFVIRQIRKAPTIEAEQRWIPVTERFPEEWVAVLVWSKFGSHETAVYLGIPGKWRVTWNHALLEEGTVTHWMPLPEPPKMDGGAEE